VEGIGLSTVTSPTIHAGAIFHPLADTSGAGLATGEVSINMMTTYYGADSVAVDRTVSWLPDLRQPASVHTVLVA